MEQSELETRLTTHLEKTHGPVAGVWHELVSDAIHLDVLIAPPATGDPATVIMTCGMSSLPMSVPKRVKNRRRQEYAELSLLLPPEWPLPIDGRTPSDDMFWPFRVLKTLARIPHDHGTWLAMGHSVPNGQPAEPWADGTNLTGAILLPAGNDPKTFRVRGRPEITLLQVFLVTSFEMQFMLEAGLLALIDAFEAKGIDAWGPLDPGRPSLQRGDL